MEYPDHRDDTVYCALCDARDATHFCEKDARYDPMCDRCYADRCTRCAYCGEEVLADELVTRWTRGTWETPPESETRCEYCVAKDVEPDWDQMRDMREDR